MPALQPRKQQRNRQRETTHQTLLLLLLQFHFSSSSLHLPCCRSSFRHCRSTFPSPFPLPPSLDLRPSVVQPSEMTLSESLTPTNVALSVFIAYLLYKLLGLDTLRERRQQRKDEEKEKRLGQDRRFTLKDLRMYDGLHSIPERDGEKAIYIAVDGLVFDVSAGSDFYGPGGPYHGFAGRDATRGLATMAVGLASDDWDDTSDLSPSERQIMLEWKEKFMGKYPIRGTLVKSE
eukprot:m.247332 g.247332  ORF g.247332 m.247332 type:complete len:233 (+) comp17156_c1_seq3:215-913(+)